MAALQGEDKKRADEIEAEEKKGADEMQMTQTEAAKEQSRNSLPTPALRN